MYARLACFVCICIPTLVFADDATISEALKRRLIDPELPLKEVQEFTEMRIPPMPEVASIAEWETYAATMRERTLQNVVLRGEAAEWAKQPTKAEYLETIDAAPDYVIKKLRFEAVPGMWIPALLYEPKDLKGKVPVVLNVNGHDSAGKAAEYKQIRCINLAKRGMLALNLEWVGMGQLRSPGFGHYKMNQLDLCGTSGLAPFFLSMRRGIDILLEHPNADPTRVGVAGLSGGGWQTIFISSLDPRVTLTNPVAGYSSFKTRARFQSDLGDSEQTPSDLATETDYALMTAMMAPKATLLTNNANDQCCFKAEHAQPPLVDAAAPIFQMYQKSAWLRTHVNHDPGSHNFEKDNREQLYKMIGDHFFGGLQPVLVKLNRDALKERGWTVTATSAALGERFLRFDANETMGLAGEINAILGPAAVDADFLVVLSRHFDGETPETLAKQTVLLGDQAVELSDIAKLLPVPSPIRRYDYSAEEIPCQEEVQTAEELFVALPEQNQDFHSLATTLMSDLPREVAYPTTDEQVRTWFTTNRIRLRKLVSAHTWDARGLLEREDHLDGLTIKYWWLRIDGRWTVPATEFVPENADDECVLLCSESGRETLSEAVEEQLAQGHRVITFDPFYYGESKISQRDFLYGLLVAATGQRDLGIQASQIAAISSWARQSLTKTKTSLCAYGPRMSLAALVAAGIEVQRYQRIELHQPYASLKEIIEQDLGVNQAPELFCFGLLKEFDGPQLAWLAPCNQLTLIGDREKLRTSLESIIDKQPSKKIAIEE